MLSVRALNTEYRTAKGPPVRAAQDVSFEVPRGKFFTLLGPSGCGKTTTLRSIAGLERPVSGEIEAAGRLVYSGRGGIFVPPNKRNFGMVFQSYAIWPHMTVFGNAAFPLEVRRGKASKAQIREKVMQVLAAVQLDHLADRDATKLSGGQQQRLALARALVMEPEILLLDEPLSNLDAKLREAMRFELKRIQRDNGLTTIYVTHDQGEALALSHEIAVMNEGRIVQIGAPRDIYNRPASKFVADFIGTTNFLGGTIHGSADDAGRLHAATSAGDMVVETQATVREGDTVAICIRPEDIELSDREWTPDGVSNIYRGKIHATVFLGDVMDVQVNVGDALLQARTHPSLRAGEGEEVHLRIPVGKCVAVAG